MINQCRGSCFSVTAGNGYSSTASFKPVGELYFTDNLDAFFPDLFYQHVFFTTTQALYYFIGIEDSFVRMLSFFKFNSGKFQLVAINFFQRTFVGKKYFVSLLFCEQRSTYSAFSA